LAVHALRQNSLTVDEGGHVLSGLLAWEDGTLDVYPVNPPLVKALVALPMLASRPKLADEVRWAIGAGWDRRNDRFIRDNRPYYLEMIFRARYVLVGLSVLGGWLIFRWASELFGKASGLVGLALWALCPNVLGWAGVCTVDLGATVFGLAAVYALRSYLHQTSSLMAAWAGCVLGLAVLSKFTLLLLYPMFLLIWLLAWAQNRHSRAAVQLVAPWRHFGIILLVSLLVINTGYGFQGTGRDLRSLFIRSRTLTGVADAPWVRGTWVERLPIPLPTQFQIGLDEQKHQAESGPPAYLRGQWRNGGWWYFYLYALAVKVPLGTWLLGGLALIMASWNNRYRATLLEEAFLLLPAGGVILLLSSQMRDQYSSLRYVLPALPFLLIWMSRVGLIFENVRLGSSRPIGLCHILLGALPGLTVATALAWNAACLLRTQPHYLCYFNELAGGPDNGWKHLIESNIDWGQDLLFLKRWVEEHPEAKDLKLAYYGGFDPHLAGLVYKLPPRADGPGFSGPKPGWYAVSVNLVCGAPFKGFDEKSRLVDFSRNAFSYFQGIAPVAKAGYSIFIYYITEEDVSRAGAS
jgi:hypothetical protein